MKCKVLVAEDELIERKVLCKTLQKYLGDLILLFEARNGREAMELFEQEAPQLVILDIEMPGLTGLEVARRIRETDKNCGILFLTGYDKFAYARQAISVRALDYLLKPYKEQELIFAVEDAIRQVSSPVAHMARPRAEAPTLKEEVDDVRTAVIRAEMYAFIENHYREDISMQDAAAALLGRLLLQAVQAVLQGQLLHLPQRVPGAEGPAVDDRQPAEPEGYQRRLRLQRRELFYKSVQAHHRQDPLGIPSGGR